MTRETRTTLEPRDVMAVELECFECGFHVRHSIEKWDTNFEKCPNCPASWPMKQQELHVALRSAVLGLRRLAAVKDNATIPFRIRFEITDPNEKP